MKKAGLNGFVYDFSVDYNAISVDNILDIHKYLIKNGIKEWYNIKCLDLLRKCFFVAMSVFSCNALKYVLINKQMCKIIPEIINVKSNEPLFYPYSILANKCSGSCNNINNPYTKLCVPDVIENINVKVFNLMSRTNQARHIEWHETCKCECRLDVSVCNNKQRWSNDKCRFECKGLIDKRIWDKGFIWNPSIFECECYKLCDTGQCLGYENRKYRKKLIDRFVEEFSENIDKNEMIHNDYGNVCNSCTIYIVLFAIAFSIIIGISSAYFYFHWYLKKDMTRVKFGTNTQTTIYWT